jgi:hypothetical protein
VPGTAALHWRHFSGGDAGLCGREKLRVPQLIAVTWLALVCALAPAYAEKRVALVVGNSKYTNIAPLRNPANDARLIADTLLSLGFTLTGGGL